MSAERIGHAPVLPQLEPILAAGGPQLPELMRRVEEGLAAIAADPGDDVGRHAAQTLSAGGKRLRPLLVFISAGKAGGGELVSAAVAVELVHMAALVHDDVLDRAELRRGRPTVFVTAGREAATATGDFLFSRAFAELVETGSVDAVDTLSMAASALARGELVQRADAWSEAVADDRYLERCALKTASLFEAACRLGAIFGEPGPRAANALGAYGARVGLAFQIFDDVLDVAGPVERTGKRRGTDLLDGTVTLPLIIARRRDAALRELDLRSVADPGEAEGICDRISATGALEEARERALAYVAEAKAAVGETELADRQRLALDLVADGVVERYA